VVVEPIIELVIEVVPRNGAEWSSTDLGTWRVLS